MSQPPTFLDLSFPTQVDGVTGENYDIIRTEDVYEILSNHDGSTTVGFIQNLYPTAVMVRFTYDAGSVAPFCQSPVLLSVNIGISPDTSTFGTLMYTLTDIDGAVINDETLTIPSGYYMSFQSPSVCNSDPLLRLHSITPVDWIPFDFTPADFTTPFSFSSPLSDVPCLLSGSMILTPSGEIPIDDLQIGDLVTTHDQRSVPITKISQSIILKSDSKNAPYRIPKNSIVYPDIPSRDVLISPRHAFYDVSKHEWTLPVWKKGIQQELVGEKVHYFHIGLPDYEKDKLVSSNLTVDSWEDNGL